MSFPGFGPANTLSSFLPEEFVLPVKLELFQDFVSKRERLTASILNIREIGSYEKKELLNGQQWFSITTTPAPKKPRYDFRTVFDLVALAGGPIGAGLSSFAHGLTGITVPTRICGTATVGGPKYLPLPYASAAGTNIEIYFDNTNVNINNGYGASLTQCYVVFEYLKT